MSAYSDAWQWLTDASHYRGSDGVPARLLEHAGVSGESLVLAGLIALPIGLVFGHLRRGGLFVTSIANAGRAVPVVGVLILLAVGPLGVGRPAAVAALVVFAIPPILTYSYTGVREVSADVRESAVGMGMRGWQVLLRVEVPLAVPLIAAGLRLAAVQVWATATLAALVGSGGFGRFILDGYSVQDYGQVYGGVFWVALTSVLLEVVGAGVERRARARLGQSPPVTMAEADEPAARTFVSA